MGVRLRAGLIVLVLVGVAAQAAPGAGGSAARGPAARAAQADCGSLGEAAAYDVFSDGAYVARSTTVHGRVAARGNVDVSQIGMGGATDGGFDVVAGGSVKGRGGEIQGDVRYGDALDFDPTFAITGGQASRGDPPFSFDEQFARLRELSATLAALPDTPGNTVDVGSGEIRFAGDASLDRHVFTVSGAQLASRPGIVIDLPAGSTAVFNVTGPQVTLTQTSYVSLVGIDAAHVLWNLDGVDTFTLAGIVQWEGTLLAPNTDVEKIEDAQNLDGQVIAAQARLGALAILPTPFAGCLPAPEPEPEPAPIALAGLCADAAGNAAMRLRNVGVDDLEDVAWQDRDGPQGGTFTARAGHDRYFHVSVADGKRHRIRVTAGATTVQATARPRPCRGRLTVTEQVVGQGPGGKWTVVLSGADGPVGSVALGDGETFASDRVPGGYQDGSVPIGESPGGVQYTVSEPDPRGGVAVVSQYLVELTDGDAADVLVATFYRGTPIIPIEPPTVPIRPTDPVRPVLPTDPIRPVRPTDPITPVVPTDPIRPVIPTDPTRPVLPTDPIRPIRPTDPTIPVVPTDPIRPPGPPEPPTGPGLIPAPPGVAAADLRVAHAVAPRRFRVGDTVAVRVRVRNRGPVAAVGAVLREVPQLRRARLRRAAAVLALRSSAGTCRRARPVRCALGTLGPGETAIVRARVRVRVPGRLYSVLVASSRTAESNLTDNVSIRDLTGRRPAPRVRVRVDAPASGRVGSPLAYRVTVVGAGAAGADAARVCTRVPAGFTAVRAPGAFRWRGMRCRDVAPLRAGASRDLVVRAVPARRGSIRVPAVAVALGSARVARAADRTRILGGCGSAARASARAPVARAAC